MNGLDFWTSVLPVINVVLALGLTVGGFIALRKGYSRETGELQERLITTLKDEVQVLTRKVDDLEQDRASQDRVLATIRYALRQYGLRIVIAGNFVTINDAQGQQKSVRVQDRASVKPLNPLDDDDEHVV